MPDYNRMQYHCEKNSALSNRLVDDFLINLCAAEEGFEKKFAGMLAGYRKIIQKMPEDWPLWLTSQYIIFQLFRKDGLAAKYLNHPRVRGRSAKELDYLKFHSEHPWRFVFCQIDEKPKDSFFEMKDVLTGEKFLLYSPGVAAIEKQRGSLALYFLLIGFNGVCWQTYGTNNYFAGIQPFDLLFFAKQLAPDLVFMNEIPMLIAENPLPFMMLWVGAEFPLTYHDKDMVVILSSEYPQKELDFKRLEPDFIMREKPPVYMFSLKHWQEHPHYCRCFYHSEKKTFSLNAMTDRGYAKLMEALGQAGYKYPQDPEIRVTPAMSTVANQVLGREIELIPYDSLFREEPSPEAEAELEKMKVFMKKLREAVNSGAKYDLRELAVLSGIEYETAKGIAEQVLERYGKMGKKG